jgi:DNA-binding winged helix-turn-helix (wHTH) protein
MAVGFYGNLRFGPFELSNRERVLRRDGVVLPPGSRALDILIYLAERPGELIAKQELLDRVWCRSRRQIRELQNEDLQFAPLSD